MTRHLCQRGTVVLCRQCQITALMVGLPKFKAGSCHCKGC